MLRTRGVQLLRSAGVSTAPRSSQGHRGFSSAVSNPEATALRLENLAAAYRRWGHFLARTNPLPEASTQHYMQQHQPYRGVAATATALATHKLDGLSGDTLVPVPKSLHMPGAPNQVPLDDLLQHLRASYTGAIGVELDHVLDPEERAWLAQQTEATTAPTLGEDERRRIAMLVQKSETFDHFMARKFPGVKRYGLEGAETMLPCLDTMLSSAASAGVEDVVVSMPHRGRLNFLVALLGLDARIIFRKVAGGNILPDDLDVVGDVVSHIGQSVDLAYDGRSVHVSLLQNPSHLEASSPVAMGKARAKMALSQDPDAKRQLCIQVHGDASVVGQGIVAETLMLSQLPGFRVGGSVHLIVNNQLGFTTRAIEGRSSPYSSDVAKAIGVPVIHVNADDPDAVVAATRMAVQYRERFRRDIFVDLIGYRRHGHNELDEPAFTQPLMYKDIRARDTVVAAYSKRLQTEGSPAADVFAETKAAFDAYLGDELKVAQLYKPQLDALQGRWQGMQLAAAAAASTSPDTGVERDTLVAIGRASVALPDGVNVHKRLKRSHVDARLKRLDKPRQIDWATAEALAIGSLMLQGNMIRLCGQDVGRGTFSQRHIMLTDSESEQTLIPLNQMPGLPDGVAIDLANSPLSEQAVLAFEYGYSTETPAALAVWEAQFGDFANVAQVIIDQMIAGSESKWLRQSGLVLLLPHGYDGAGPEHSSARLERFLQLTDGDSVDPSARESNVNMHVVNCSTPANYFHVLRRQLARPFRKPLVVMGPKTLLRLAACVSDLDEMQPGTSFQPVLPDPDVADPAAVTHVLLCSGRLYYDLVAEREKRGSAHVAVVRVEELAPFPHDLVAEQLATYPNAKAVRWCQEESMNAGAWQHVQPRLARLADVQYAGRGPLAAPAVGIGAVHRREVQQLMDQCFRD